MSIKHKYARPLPGSPVSESLSQSAVKTDSDSDTDTDADSDMIGYA
jgi:hypothetical protein